MEVDVAIRNKRRRRSLSASSSSSGSSASSCSSSSLTPPPNKFHRLPSPTESSIPKDYICTLQPTCSQPGTSTRHSTLEQLERHQASFHNWICKTLIRDHDRDAKFPPSQNVNEKEKEEIPETFIYQKGAKRWKECNKVFPDQRLLDLHEKETHDPLIRQKKEKGEKTFECFLPPDQCKRKFTDPKQRRKHLIDKHKYPHQYFFSITNHGLNELVRQDGLGISLIRPRKEFPEPQPEILIQNPITDSTLTTPINANDSDTNHQNQNRKETPDVEIDDLTKAMGGLESSLTFIPRGLRKKASAAIVPTNANRKMYI